MKSDRLNNIQINLRNKQRNHIKIRQKRMVLQKFQMCDPGHSKQFEFCCIKDNKVFCAKCWYNTQHNRQCQSTRCGHYQKLAHLVINRALQLKNIYYLKNMSSNAQACETARIKLVQLNFQVTQLMRQWVDQKIPLLIWSMMNQMLHSKFSQHWGLSCNKYDAMCTQMVKTIKNPEEHKKADYLETIISNYETINHEVDGNINSIKEQDKQLWKGKKDDKIEESLAYCRKHLGLLLVNVRTQMKDMIEAELGKLLSGFDSSIKFKGVSFVRSAGADTIGLFKKKEHYRNLSLNSDLFGKFEQRKKGEIYNGFNISIPQLENNPEQLLQVGKSFIKEKLFTLYSEIETFKSTYPYKCSYVISTCLQPDQEYQETVLQLEKAYIKSIQTKSKTPFMNSLSIVIMGPETIVVRFRNRPEFCYTIKIYNYKKSRESYYKKLREILEISTVKQKPQRDNDKHIEFPQNPSLLQLAYANFQIAYEEIFLNHNFQDKIFEGQKVVANRGMQKLTKVVDKWKKQAVIDLQFKLSREQILQLIV